MNSTASRERELTFQVTLKDRSFDFDDQKLFMVPAENPEFVRGFWTKDRAGKEPLEKAVLGDTVYFQVITKGLSDGREITLQLFEYDYNFFIDWLDPDDNSFSEKEIIRKGTCQIRQSSRRTSLRRKLGGYDQRRS